MTERNKKTPWDEELQAQVLAEEQAKRKQANAEKLAAFEALSAQQAQEQTPQAPDPDDSDIAPILSEAIKPPPEPDKPTLGVEVEKTTFATEDSAVEHFERAFKPSGGPENLWTQLEDRFGAKELRIYLGTAVLILIVLLFSTWFNMSARGIKSAKDGLDKHNATVQAGQDAAEGLETAE